MTIKSIKIEHYQTADGTMFEHRGEAEAHELQVEYAERIERFIGQRTTDDGPLSPDSRAAARIRNILRDWIVFDAERVRETGASEAAE